MYFRIEEIKAGWFDVTITDGKHSASITDSDYLDNNAPAKLLDSFIALMEGQTSKVWLCWHDEPGAYIWSIVNNADMLDISIGIAKKDAWKIRGNDLSKEAIYRPLLDIQVPLDTFVQEVVAEFARYSSGEGLRLYEAEWMEFPEDLFRRLKHLLQ